MCEITVRPYDPLDYREMEFRDIQERDFLLSKCAHYFYVLQVMCRDSVWTIRNGDKIAVIVGFSRLEMGYSEVFFFASKYLDELFCMDMYEAIINLKKKAISVNYKLQTTCKACDTYEGRRNRKFLEKIGFKQEALLRKIGIDGADMYIYSLIKEEAE